MKILFSILFLLNFFVPVFADESLEAQALLQKIQTASKQESYVGIFVLQRENQLIASRIVHRYVAGDEQEKIEKLDGLRRVSVRHNEDIISYQPGTKTLRTEKRQTQDVFPAVLSFNSHSLIDHYQLKLAENARVAGVECRMVTIEPKDNIRYGYRLCAAIPSNLMVLAQTIDLNRQIVEQIAFTSLVFGTVDENSLKVDFADTAEWKTVHGAVAVSTESGWSVKNLPAGFKKIREVRRLINAGSDGARRGKPDDLHEVLQMVFSDSLASVSVFIEPISLEHRAGIVQQGATTIAGFQSGNFWITLVGEVPVAAIKLMSDSIEYKQK